jgi:hypothetical protein
MASCQCCDECKCSMRGAAMLSPRLRAIAPVSAVAPRSFFCLELAEYGDCLCFRVVMVLLRSLCVCGLPACCSVLYVRRDPLLSSECHSMSRVVRRHRVDEDCQSSSYLIRCSAATLDTVQENTLTKLRYRALQTDGVHRRWRRYEQLCSLSPYEHQSVHQRGTPWLRRSSMARDLSTCPKESPTVAARVQVDLHVEAHAVMDATCNAHVNTGMVRAKADDNSSSRNE